MKADDKVKFEENEEENFTEFQYLKTRFDVLERVVDNLVKILNENDLYATKKIEAEEVNVDEIFEILEERYPSKE